MRFIRNSMLSARRLFMPMAVMLINLLSMSACSNGGNAPAVSVERLKETLAKDPSTIVIDVRTPEELRGALGALDGIINIPVQELESRMKELDLHKGKPVYVICRSGNRSGTAVAMMKEQGHTAFNVTGGMIAWREKIGTANR